jgi:hypothetical protein
MPGLSNASRELEEIRGKIHALRDNWDGDRDREIRAVTLELGNLRQRLNRLTNAYLDRMIDKQAFEERRTSLLFEEKAIEDRMREIKDGKHPLPDRLDNFLELIKALCCNYKTAIPEEKREILRSVTSNRAIGPKNVEIQLRSPFLELASRGIVQCGGHDQTVPRTLEGSFDDAAGSPPGPSSSRLDAFFETLVGWLENNPDAFAPTTANVSTDVNELN